MDTQVGEMLWDKTERKFTCHLSKRHKEYLWNKKMGRENEPLKNPYMYAHNGFIEKLNNHCATNL